MNGPKSERISSPGKISLTEFILVRGALVRSCILPMSLDCVFIHLARRTIQQLYSGLPEDDASCVETSCSS